MPSRRRTLAQKKREISSEATLETVTVVSKSANPFIHQIPKQSKSITKEEFEQILLENKRKKLSQKISRKYTYLFSDNYQNIERLLATRGKSFKARSTDHEFFVLEELGKKKIEKKRKETKSNSDFREPYLTRNFKGKRSRGHLK